jgi:hypothetical protein
MRARGLSAWGALVALALWCAGCASLPAEPAQQGLYLDLLRVVENEARTQWLVDRLELEEIAAQTLRSTCQAPPEVRAGLRQWIEGQVAVAGGPAEAAFARTGSLDGLDEALTLERVGMALDYGEVHREDCPFWLKEEAAFRGVHADTERLVLLVESSGGGSLILTPARSRVGGDGSGRVLLGWGVDSGLTLALGGEFGGRGLLSTRPEDDALGTFFTAGAPLLARFYDLTRVYDVEVAAVAFSPTDEVAPRFGARAVFAAGVTTARVGAFMPLAMLQVTYDYYPASRGEPETHILRLGTRVSLDIDP